MSHHFSAASLKSPGDDPRLDLTDLYVFEAPEDPGNTVLIMDVNPFRTDTLFRPDAVYRINVDNDGDAQAEVAFRFGFSEPDPTGQQVGTAYYTSGSPAREHDPADEVAIASIPVGLDATAQPFQAGPVKLFAGVRSDPFFADAEGALHGFQWTGQDTFANTNVLCIAVEVPDDVLGGSPDIGTWATTSLRTDGRLTQMDRGGHPTINPFVNPDAKKDEYNTRDPVDDLANYLVPWSDVLEQMGGYSPAEAKAAARTVLPDILHYDRSQPARYPNGRSLTDDVYSDRFAWLTHGRAGPDGLRPHADLQAKFPYLGTPVQA
jgi:Domain of unknown function (DUF4331)